MIGFPEVAIMQDNENTAVDLLHRIMTLNKKNHSEEWLIKITLLIYQN
jgi:hypothetical protein